MARQETVRVPDASRVIDVVSNLLNPARRAEFDRVNRDDQETLRVQYAVRREKPLRTYDAALAMYHDQALVPLKALDFDEGVNVTLGLPIVRTSPDHGTAFDIAGKGLADPGAMMAALRMASAMAERRALS